MVAKNARSERSVEYHMNGFDFDEVEADYIQPVPESVVKRYIQKSKPEDRKWPWYVYGKEFFEDLGAEFRSIGGKQEMLLCDVVYDVTEFVPCGISRMRTVGEKATTELKALDSGEGRIEYDEDDEWLEPDVQLITMIGMCLVRCQQIEHYICESFILGISKKQKAKYETINDLKEGWRKKTLGGMFASMKEAWEIDPILDAGFQLFLDMRNQLVHGLTTSDRYDIKTYWGQQELIAFIMLFDVISKTVKAAFKSSYFASIEYGMKYFGISDDIPEDFLSYIESQDKSLFASTFNPIDGAI